MEGLRLRPSPDTEKQERENCQACKLAPESTVSSKSGAATAEKVPEARVHSSREDSLEEVAYEQGQEETWRLSH